MPPVVFAAAIAFGPHLSVLRKPARSLGRLTMQLLDRRRRAIDARAGI